MKRLLLALTVVGIAFVLAAPSAVVAQELTVDDYINFWRPIVGTWEGTIEMDEKTSPIAFRIRVAPNKKCFIRSVTIDGVPGSQQLESYDPVAKQGVISVVDNEGRRTTQIITIDGLKKEMTAAEGVGGTFTIEVYNPDGTTAKMTSRWTITELDEKHYTIVWSDGGEGGDPKPVAKMVLERQPERQRRARQ